ncbi:hypothetical protein [Humidesulfovibrio idahonensis]
MERETLLAKLLDMLREDERPAMETKIAQALAEHTKGAANADEAEALSLRFLKDLDIFVNWRGADFMYSRGIAETLRVGEDIWELAYQFKKAMC